MTPAQLAEIQARAEKASVGPWRSEYERLYRSAYKTGPAIDFWPGVEHGDPQQARDDAYFAACARTDIPNLLAHIATLEWRRENAAPRLRKPPNNTGAPPIRRKSRGRLSR